MSDEEQRIILCARTDGLPQEMVGDSARLLASCGHEVWISRGAMQVHLGMGAKVMCTVCGTRRMQQSGDKPQVQMVPGGLAEIEATHGKNAREYTEKIAKALGIETYG
jgi:hypothetical protein